MSIRNYNAFLKAVKAKHEISHEVAWEIYRRVKTKLGRPLFGTDVRKHPVIVKRAIVPAKAAVTRAKKKKEVLVLPPPPKRKRRAPAPAATEYVLHFDYGKTRKASPIDVQVHLRGPADATDKEIKTQYKTWWETGNLPRGWSVKAIAWKHGARGRAGSGAPNKVRDYLGFVLRGRAKRIT